MGRATVDLPDPLDTLPPTSLAGTDDLLAQMAGDEIDRLLAESGVEPDARPASAASAPKSPASAAAPPEAKAVEPRGVDGKSAPPAVVVEPAVAVDDEAIAEAPPLSPAQLESDAELDALLDEMSRAEREGLADAPATPAIPTAPAAAGAAAVGKSVEAPAPAADDGIAPTMESRAPAVGPAPAGESLMSAAERDALSLSDIAAETDAAEERDAAVSNAATSGRPTFLVRLLEWLDGRLAFVPDGLRDAMGKIAIVTLLNALAVLIYVLFFRG